MAAVKITAQHRCERLLIFFWHISIIVYSEKKYYQSDSVIDFHPTYAIDAPLIMIADDDGGKCVEYSRTTPSR